MTDDRLREINIEFLDANYDPTVDRSMLTSRNLPLPTIEKVRIANKLWRNGKITPEELFSLGFHIRKDE